MAELTAFEQVLAFADERELKCITNKNYMHFPLFPIDPIFNKKFIVSEIGDVHLCLFDSYASKAYTSTTFTGLYAVIDFPEEAHFYIYKKNWVDRFFRIGKIKTGEKYLDEKLTITSNTRWMLNDLIERRHIDLFLGLCEIIRPLELKIGIEPPLVLRHLQGKKVIGLETNYWIYKRDELTALIDGGQKLLSSFKERIEKQLQS